ncbi:ankyrin repeat domain-containing protein [Candidatus Dependentiae bacterium]|nr:ankyrin repeat domain-containing protein [Candidatus Dependentiae bacterium]
MKNFNQNLILFIFLLISQTLELSAMKESTESFHHAIRANDIDTIQRLITNNSALVNQKEYCSRNTPLHTAIEAKSFVIIELLINNGANVNEARSMNMSPLHHLAFKSDKDAFSTRICKLLIQHGAHVNATNKYGKTALHLASAKGDSALVKKLLKYGADKTIKDQYNKTALNCVKNNSSIVDILSEYDSDSSAKRIEVSNNNNNQSPKKRARAAEYLPANTHKVQKIENCHELNVFSKVDPEKKDFPDANPTNNNNNSDNTSHELTKSLNVVIDHGTDLNARYSKRKLALQLSSFNKSAVSLDHDQKNNNCPEIETSQINNIAECNNQNLPTHKTDITSNSMHSFQSMQHAPLYTIKTDEFGHTPLYLAAAQNNDELVQNLLNCVMSTRAKRDVVMTANRFNNTALHAAAANGNLTITIRLINALTDQTEKQNFVMMKDKFGNTALHLAFGLNHLNIVKAILGCFKNLADQQEFILIKNESGKTALDIFKHCEYKETVNFLEKILRMNNDNNNFDDIFEIIDWYE